MEIVENLKDLCLESIPVDSFWNTGDERELKIHRIHAYPAKFPAFITTRALQYAKDIGVTPTRVADVFCGCGTVSIEAKRHGIDFWGCDINPVATLIARTKSRKYKSDLLTEYYKNILSYYKRLRPNTSHYEDANERLKYWYYEEQFLDLYKLKRSIEHTVPQNSPYRLFFMCAFSNILKPTSRWLTKSIKPQIDPEKEPADVLQSFAEQFLFMETANEESDATIASETKIITQNFLNNSLSKPKVDMIITSPPYVTSYEYADLHQLSSLWLGYTENYKELRDGSIGSLQHSYNYNKELKNLNDTGTQIVFTLHDKDKAQARSVAKYYLDMQRVTKECHSMLAPNGIGLFVIGNTEYKGVRIDNAKHLIESMEKSGFKKISITKRKITNKILTPYRDSEGRFTNDKRGRKIYSEEFIIIGQK